MSANPSSPIKVGPLEWFPRWARGLLVDRSLGQSIRLEPPTDVEMGSVWVNVGSFTPGASFSVDVVTEANPVRGAGTVNSYRPTSFSANTNIADQVGGTTNLHQKIADTPDDDATWLNGTGDITFEFSGLAGLSAALRVVEVRHRARGRYSLVYVQPDGGSQLTQAFPLATAFEDHAGVSWPTKADGTAWLVTDLQAGGFGVKITWPGPANLTQLAESFLDVTTAPEHRLAVGTLTPTAAGWVEVALTDPAGGTPMSGTAPLLAIVYPMSGSGVSEPRMTAAALDAGADHPEGVWSFPVELEAALLLPDVVGTKDTAAPACVLLDNLGAVIVGQPWAVLAESTVNAASGAVTQTVPLPDTASRGWLSFTARQASTATTASLAAKLKRTSDGVQIGGTVTVYPFHVRSAPRLPQLIELPAASAGAGTAADHYVEFTSADVAGWLVSQVEVGLPVPPFDTDPLIPVLVGRARTSPAGQTAVPS